MFVKIAISALIAGFGAGLCAALLQFMYVQPLLIHAELFETGQLVHFGNNATAAVVEPAEHDLERHGLNVLFNALLYVGYAFLLLSVVAFSELTGRKFRVKCGLIWGICGFIVVQLAPAFGLPPELPGMNAADVEIRQIWWFCTVFATAASLWLIAFSQRFVFVAAAIVMIAVPHLIGAPPPDTFTGPAPAELAAEFAARTLGAGLASWAILGVMCLYVWRSRWSEVS